MPDPSDAQCLREFHRLMHERATADLPGAVGLAPTLAYTDLIFSFAFARIGAEADSLACERAAAEVLEPRTELAHQWLLSLFRYRIGAARRGEPHGGIVPHGAGLPTATELLAQHDGRLPVEVSREFYTARTLICRVPTLDPEAVTDPYSDWTKHSDAVERAVARLGDERDPNRIETEAVALLTQMEALPPLQRLRRWARLYALVRRAGRAIAIELTLAVPNVVRVPYEPNTDWNSLTIRALRDALDFVSHLDDTGAFSPLLDAIAERVRAAPDTAGRSAALAALAWPCVRWFRRRGSAGASALLDRTREQWPKDVRKETAAPLSSEDALPVLNAHLAGAVCREYAGEVGATARALAEVSEAIAARGAHWLPAHLSVALACAVATASGAISTELARTAIPDFVHALPGLTNAFTTGQYYSRFHLQLAEAVALALPAVGDW